MVFSSTVFLFLFLPLVLGSALLVPPRWRNAHLLLASLVFYAWGEAWVVLALLGSIAGNWGLGLWVARRRTRSRVGLAVALNLLLLGVFKYADFVATNLNALLAPLGLGTLPLPGITLPIGISFFTFQAISYVVDVHRRDVDAQRDPLVFGLYLSLFPQLIAGPIVRYGHVAAQLVRRRITWEGVSAGVQRFVIGLAKKVVVANTVAELADEVFAADLHQLGGGLAWLAMLAYTLQIYFDFSGYSDMAIGLGRILGFQLPENFRWPYVARSIREIWTRWHVSLTTWFRDYVYVPMGGNRRGGLRTTANLLTVFVLCGLWHGASWNFVVFGLYQGAFLVLERSRGFTRLLRGLWRPLQHAYALGVWMLGLAIFRTESLPDARRVTEAMLGLHGWESSLVVLVRNDELLMLVLGAAAALPWVPWLRERAFPAWEHAAPGQRWGAGWGGVALHLGATASLLAILALSLLQLAGGTHDPFLYFRF